MGNFRRDDRSSGGGFSRGGFGGGNKSFGGPKRFDGGRDGGRPTMHKATCSECGDDCEIPFRPSGGRPVFCSVCFDKQGGGSSSRPSFGGDRRERRERPSFDRGDREMFDVVCDKCGENCQVPFRPTVGKPVFCSNCFDKGDKGSKGGGGSYEDLKTINAKLDMIMTALGLSPEKTSKKEKKENKKEVVEMEVGEVEKPKAKKATSKKEVKPKKEVKEKKVKEAVKKAPAKKKVVAKKKK